MTAILSNLPKRPWYKNDMNKMSNIRTSKKAGSDRVGKDVRRVRKIAVTAEYYSILNSLLRCDEWVCNKKSTLLLQNLLAPFHSADKMGKLFNFIDRRKRFYSSEKFLALRKLPCLKCWSVSVLWKLEHASL